MPRSVRTSRRALLAVAVMASLGAAALPQAAGAAAATTRKHSILASRQLWSTVDVCNPKDQKDTIGVRGSMPGDGTRNETMFMRFQIQYRDAKSGKWLAISSGADSGWVNVGSASFRVREAGRSFVFRPTPGTPAYRLRGLVLFQWRTGTKVVRAASRYTAAGHLSAAGADPKNYSATTCIIV
jgi:hypothetical protein